MKRFLAAFVVVAAATATTLTALAAPDYARLKKDVSVMTQILKSAFSADDNCRSCRVRADGLYLAKQGFVFTIHDIDGGWFHEHNNADSMAFIMRSEDIETIEEIPHMVGQIVSDMASAIPEFEVEVDQLVARIDGSTRNALREIRREQRDLQRDIREQEIELIHADDERRAQIENDIATLEQALLELEEQEQSVEARTMAQREEMRKKMEARREAQAQKRREQQAKIQTRVLQAFCDYGSTLQSLPSSENITVVFANDHGNEDNNTIYVFNRSDIVNCNRDKDKLQSEALKYQF